MTITLYGSTTSPYARRVRLYMEGEDYQFNKTQILTPEGHKTIAALSPIVKIPVMVENEGQPNQQIVYDSKNIFEYIRRQRGDSELSADELNLVYVIDAVTESFFHLAMAAHSGLDVSQDVPSFSLARQRAVDCLNWLEERAVEGAFEEWRFPMMSLLATIDWIDFRNHHALDAFNALNRARLRFADREIVQATECSE